ncbi:hypothetical protein P3T39_005663 [Kitasatospora sp. GP82]|nr:hypothetical protein [Kitasatospora sp. GP82]
MTSDGRPPVVVGVDHEHPGHLVLAWASRRGKPP